MTDATHLPAAKACTGCEIVKPLEDFTYDKRHSDGRQSRCRACVKAYQKRYREADPERYKQLRRAEYERHRPKILEASRTYRALNREAIRERESARRERWTAEELEAFRARRREVSRRYRERFPELCNERIRTWGKANREKRLEYFHRRRARMRWNQEPESFTRNEIGERDGWRCGICHQLINQMLTWPDRGSPSLDHVIPLSHGGPHTRANCRITHLHCNVRRGANRQLVG